jgi:hypothetical protein
MAVIIAFVALIVIALLGVTFAIANGTWTNKRSSKLTPGPSPKPGKRVPGFN